ncbi:hypothetical protein BDP27DRAFT_1315486 [Rhodocollybia butyracea]|uniref:Uncharacterized protein n=1 Tax=Rhodocollybia butyracea TaxID=206335 RepID=A0A9P5Q4V6_9AGAR|nr:hypothetical protein BDP27DRAFT_1315486 [Rhodocollybia butyracea]
MHVLTSRSASIAGVLVGTLSIATRSQAAQQSDFTIPHSTAEKCVRFLNRLLCLMQLRLVLISVSTWVPFSRTKSSTHQVPYITPSNPHTILANKAR